MKKLIVFGLVLVLFVVGLWTFTPPASAQTAPADQNLIQSLMRILIDLQNQLIALLQSRSAIPTTPQNESEGWTTYRNEKYQFSFSHPNTLIVNQAEENKWELLDVGTAKSNPISITLVSGQRVTDANGKFGSVTYYQENGGWYKIGTDYRTGESLPAIAVQVVQRTSGGSPIFIGSTPSQGWGSFTYIVALSSDRFLVVKGPDSTVNSSLFGVVETITRLN